MQRFFLVAVMLVTAFTASSQHTFKAKIINKETGEGVALASVTLLELKRTAAADSAGIILIKDIPAGKYTIKITSIGYAEKEVKYRFSTRSGCNDRNGNRRRRGGRSGDPINTKYKNYTGYSNKS